MLARKLANTEHSESVLRLSRPRVTLQQRVCIRLSAPESRRAEAQDTRCPPAQAS